MTALAGSLLALQLALGICPRLDVVYPRVVEPDSIARIAKVSENFIFGSVLPPEAELPINDSLVTVHHNGAFLAWLPVDWEKRVYRLTAVCAGDTTRLELPFAAPPVATPPAAPKAAFPALIRIGAAAARTHPQGAYYLFPTPDTWVTAKEWREDYFRVELSPGRSVWVPGRSVLEIRSTQGWEPFGIVWKAAVSVDERWEAVEVPVGRQVLFRISESDGGGRLTVELFGVVSHLDLVSYPSEARLIREITWDQPEDQIFQLEVILNEPVWGYQAEWTEGRFVLKIRKPPRLGRDFDGLKIAIDPGHGGDEPGAIGPTRVMEKEVNLLAARALRECLTDKGAEVFITREDDATLTLQQRIDIARDKGGDLLISLHHNALPDGVNPFGEFGAGTYYYQPHSRDLAREIQREVGLELKLPDEGVFYNNLALVRPTAMPAVLLEAAYVMLPEQEMLMQQEDYPDRLAQAVTAGIQQFLDKRFPNR